MKAHVGLSRREHAYMERVLGELAKVPWAIALVRAIEQGGGITAANAPLLFEARFAFALLQQRLAATYEFNAGVGATTVDFLVPGASEWLIELVSIQPSAAVQRAEWATTEYFGLALLSPNLSDPPKVQQQSEEGEMILVEQKIVEKVYAAGIPVKFPPPSGRIHAILVDMRGYLFGGDGADYFQICYGPHPALGTGEVLSWLHKGQWTPIRGIFEAENPLRGAATLRERIHYVGFVAEHEYRDGELLGDVIFWGNPELLKDRASADRIAGGCPFKTGSELIESTA